MSETITTHPWLKAAIDHLAAHCDGAIDKDHEGFSKADAAYGARMHVEMSERELNDAEQFVIREILVKYHRTQLEPAGLKVPSADSLASFLGVASPEESTPETRGEVLARLQANEARRQGNHRKAEQIERKQREKSDRGARESAPHVRISAGRDGEIECRWDRKVSDFGLIIDAVRSIEGRRYVPPEAGGPYWGVPESKVSELFEKMGAFTCAWEPSLLELAEGVASGRVEKPAGPPRITIRALDAHQIAICFAFGPDFDRIKDICKFGLKGRYSPSPWPHWAIPAGYLQVALDALSEWRVEIEDKARAHAEVHAKAIEARVEAERQRMAQEAARKDAERLRRARELSAVLACLPNLEASFEYAPPGFEPETWHYLKHQQEGIPHLIRECFKDEQKGAICADDMGLGKTLEALIVARSFRLAFGTRTLVVAPVNAHGAWRRASAGIGEPVELFSAAKIPPPPEGCDFVLIADEAHYFQNWGYFKVDPKTGEEVIKGPQRTAKFERLADRARAVLMLTGTPMRNGRPRELYPLLHAARHHLTLGAGAKKKFEERYCAAEATRFSQWDTTGASHMDEFHQKTKAVVLRRLKGQCLDLPELTRIPKECDVSPADRALYMETVTKKAEEYYERVDKGRADRAALFAEYQAYLDATYGDEAPRTSDYKDELWRDACDALDPDKFDEFRAACRATFQEEGEALVFLTHVRYAASKAKIASAIELVEDIVAEGRQVVVFSAFAPAAKAIGEHFHVPVLDGSVRSALQQGETVSPRQKMCDEFQAGKRKVFVGTIAAGGVSITLTAASDVILVDRPWTSEDARQAEDRINRIGQKNAMTSYWLSAFPICEKIDEILLAKHERIELMLSGKRKTLKGVKTMSTTRLAAELLPMFLPERRR